MDGLLVKHNRFPFRNILIFLLILQSLILSTVFLAPARFVIVIIFGIIAVFFLLIYSDPLIATLLLATLVTIVLPRPTGRTLIFKAEEILPLVSVFFLLLSILQGDNEPRPISKIGNWLLGFFLTVIVSAIIGVLKERDIMLIIDELLMIAMWGGYLILIKTKITQQQVKHLLYAIIVGSLIVALYYIFEFVLLSGASRFRTDQQHIFNVAIPLLFAILLYDTRNIIKVLAIILMIPMIFAVYITLTRSLWLLIPLTIVWQYFYFIREERKHNRAGRALFPLLIIFSITILGLVLFGQVFGIQRMLGERFTSFRILEYDISLLARAELSRYVFERVRLSPIFGVGLADFLRYQYFPTLGRYNVYWLDGSFLQVLWKTGIIGLILFSGFLFYFLKRAWFVLKKSHEVFDKIIGSGIFFSMLGLIITGIQSGIMIAYRFNFVWALLCGIIEIRAQEIQKKENELLLL